MKVAVLHCSERSEQLRCAASSILCLGFYVPGLSSSFHEIFSYNSDFFSSFGSNLPYFFYFFFENLGWKLLMATLSICTLYCEHRSPQGRRCLVHVSIFHFYISFSYLYMIYLYIKVKQFLKMFSRLNFTIQI